MMMSHKEWIEQLAQEEVPEVINIYQGTFGFIDRMLLWDCIEKINWGDKRQETSEAAVKACYHEFIGDISSFIKEETDSKTRTSLRCLLAKMQRGQIKATPREFINEMAAMVEKEDELISKYSSGESHLQENFRTTLNFHSKDESSSIVENLKCMAEGVNTQLMECYKSEMQVLQIVQVYSTRGQEVLEELKNRSFQFGQVCCDRLDVFFRTFEDARDYLVKSKTIFQKNLAFQSIDLVMTEEVMTLEALDTNFQVWTGALCSVKEAIVNYAKNMEDLYTQYPQAPKTGLFTNIKTYLTRLEECLYKYREICVVTTSNPVNQYLDPSVVSTKKKEGVAEGVPPGEQEAGLSHVGRSKATPSKKKKSPQAEQAKREKGKLNSTLRILGSKSFGSNFSIKTDSSTVRFVDDNSLPQSSSGSSDLEPKSANIKILGKLKPEEPPVLKDDSSELTFYREEIGQMSRPNKNDEQTVKIVCANFARLFYKIDVEMYGHPYSLYTVSLPIGLMKGSAQVLPFHGSLTWYIWNVDNVYENFRIPQELPTEQVADMLDARISNIRDDRGGGSQKTKSRALSSSDKEFLLGLLLGEDTTSKTISLIDFLSTKPPFKRKVCGENSKDVLDCSFYTYFYALVNSLNGFMKGLWLDCIMYAICSSKESRKVLQRENTNVGTIILRPSLTKPNNVKCLKAHLNLALDFKTNQKSGEIGNIIWTEEHKNYLPQALMDYPGFKYIQGVNHRSPVADLEKYFSNDATVRYHSTEFRLKMSIEVLSNHKPSEEDDRKKSKVQDLVKAASPASTESSYPCPHNNQQMLTSPGGQLRHEMSPTTSSSVLSPLRQDPNLAAHSNSPSMV